MSFSRELSIDHGGDDFKRQNLNCFRVKFNEDNDAVLDFIETFDGDLLEDRFPLEGIIESVPLFVNAKRYPLQNMSDLVTKTINDNTNVAIEFRTAENENMADATSWKSVSTEGALNNDIGMGEKGTFSEFKTSADELILTDIENGINIKVEDGSEIGESFVFANSPEVETPTSTKQAKYFVFDVESSRGGFFLEVHVLHGLTYSVDVPFGDSPPPFKHLVQICNKSTPQTIYWDITDWPSGERNFDYIRVIAFKATDVIELFEINITNIRLFEIDDSTVSPPVGTVAFPAELKRFIQYRVVFSTVEAGITPEVKRVKFDFDHRLAILPSNLMRHQKFSEGNGVSYPIRRGLDIDYS